MPLLPSDLETIATSPLSGTNDAGSVTARDADDTLKLLDRAAGVDALTPANPQGGPRSAFGLIRPARATMPGAK